LAANESFHDMGGPPPSGVNVTWSKSARSARGKGVMGPPRAIFAVGRSCRQCEKLQRCWGKRRKLPSSKRICLSGGGGVPCIQWSATGSEALVSGNEADCAWAAAAADANISVAVIAANLVRLMKPPQTAFLT
jgi:hypothetical protein